MVLSPFRKINRIINKGVQEHGAPYELFGVFAVVNYIVPYFMWSPAKTSNFELLIVLRLVAGIMSFLLIIKDYWSDFLQKYLPLYWYATLFYCLPFITSYMLFDSQGDTFWLLNMILAIFLLTVLVDWKSFLALLFLGMLGAYFFYSLVGEAETFTLSKDTLYWVIYMCFFSSLVGVLFSRRNEKIAQERLNAYKTVSASIAHEMRTPLSSMYISSQNMGHYLIKLLDAYREAKKNNIQVPKIEEQKIKLLEKFPEHLSYISRRTISIIDVFLANFSNVDEKTVDVENISISQIIHKAVAEYPFFSEKERALVAISDANDFCCLVNESLLVHVFYNLMKNSLSQIQISKKGEIKIFYSQEEHYNVVHFLDTASGIKSSEIPKIFDDFYTKTFHGAGLGLAYCRKVMQACGGSIKCLSQLGDYTEFRLYFPNVSHPAHELKVYKLKD
ncbi:MAG: HAMP domain-containing histidine kinase [Myxococcales bacterium]|nr:MAG: HAMP domain-containing histidine kinase [Myxococcales bacterium]